VGICHYFMHFLFCFSWSMWASTTTLFIFYFVFFGRCGHLPLLYSFFILFFVQCGHLPLLYAFFILFFLADVGIDHYFMHFLFCFSWSMWASATTLCIFYFVFLGRCGHRPLLYDEL